MSRTIVIKELLQAMDRQTATVTRFARRHGVKDLGFEPTVKQETALRIIEKAAGSFREDLGTADAYVARILYYVCLEVRRTFYHQPNVPQEFDSFCDELSPPAILIRREEIADAEAALLRLSASDRNAVNRWAGKEDPEREKSKAGYHNSTIHVRNYRVRQRFLLAIAAVRSARVKSQIG